jgi:uncharacterized protein (TIGR00369 family)
MKLALRIWSKGCSAHVRTSKFSVTKAKTFGGLDKDVFCELLTVMTPLNRDFYKAVVTSLDTNELVVSLPFRKEFIGNPQIPSLHNGVVATLIDHVAGFCAWSTLESSFLRVSTVDLAVDYIRPAPCEDLHFDAIVVSRTRQLVRVDVTCWDLQRTKKIAIGRCLFNIYDGKSDLGLLVQQFKAGGILP